jgi:hypothetical protein
MAPMYLHSHFYNLSSIFSFMTICFLDVVLVDTIDVSELATTQCVRPLTASWIHHLPML